MTLGTRLRSQSALTVKPHPSLEIVGSGCWREIMFIHRPYAINYTPARINNGYADLIFARQACCIL